MWQITLITRIISHSPDGEPTPVPSNSTTEGEVMTRTGGGSCSELPSNITWMGKYGYKNTKLHYTTVVRTCTSLHTSFYSNRGHYFTVY